MKVLKRLLKTAWESNQKFCLIVMGQNLFEALISIIDILGIGSVIDALVTRQEKSRVFSIIMFYVLIHTGISLTRELLTWRKNVEARKSTNQVQYQYAKQSLEVDFPYIQTGAFLNLKRNSMKIMPAFYIATFGELLSYIVRFIGIFWIFARIGPWLVLCIILLSIPAIRMSFFQKKEEFQYRQNITLFERKSDYLYKTMTEYAYAKDIRIYGGEEMIAKKYTANAEEQIKKQKKLGLRNTKIQSITYLFGTLQLLFMLIFFSYMVFRGEISIAEYTMLLSSTTLFASLLNGFFNNIAQIKATCGYANLMDEYNTFIADNSRVYNSKNSEKEWEQKPFSIDFEHVSFRYPGGNPVLEDVSFHIEPGEKVSFVGLNGAGKTTVVKLLFRLYEPDLGEIKINGVNIRKLDSKEYYKQIGIVLQDFYIFAYSVMENLCFDRKEEPFTLEQALEQAGIKERIARLPKGLATFLYKNLDAQGEELSGGEGQKLAMARALCKNTGLLVLDEPTSSLDPLAEYEIFQKMRQIAKGNTTIMISHRLSSTKYSDRILVFDKGRLIQEGSHQELMEDAGMYQELYLTQAKYYTREDGLYEV
ncbi:MAG: ABC transporter ATP-binding protein/permease [Lachnospiraceae bacterium]|nr:ABC transporter ATP-binding protein/permease [Lachnospiraceae bacterium]